MQAPAGTIHGMACPIHRGIEPDPHAVRKIGAVDPAHIDHSLRAAKHDIHGAGDGLRNVQGLDEVIPGACGNDPQGLLRKQHAGKYAVHRSIAAHDDDHVKFGAGLSGAHCRFLRAAGKFQVEEDAPCP